jgi:hypothetical protein
MYQSISVLWTTPALRGPYDFNEKFRFLLVKRWHTILILDGSNSMKIYFDDLKKAANN